MKLSWGVGIAIFYSSFVVVMIGMVIYSKTFDPDLVVDNYYEEDLAFQSRLDASENERALEHGLIISKKESEKTVCFEFPEGQSVVNGKISFYRPDDKSKDFEVSVENFSGKAAVRIPYDKIALGLWKVKVSWAANGIQYYREDLMVL
jgi:nitrogen fixation protein FixH